MTNKVRSRIRTSENGLERESASGDSLGSDHGCSDADHKEDATSSGASTPRGDAHPSPFGVSSSVAFDEKSPGKSSKSNNEKADGKSGIHKIISSKAEAWIAKKGILWPWKGNEHDSTDSSDTKNPSDQENDVSHPKTSESNLKPENQANENNRAGNNEASGSWSSFNANSTSSVSSSGSTSSSAVQKVDGENDCLDYEILWEDLTIGEQIGQGNHLRLGEHAPTLCSSWLVLCSNVSFSGLAGSCGTVYHALWYGSVSSI